MNMDGKDPERVPSTYSGVIALPLAESPCSTLPHELLALIFIYAKDKKRVAHRIPIEVSVSHVCRFWRSVALDTPVLWNRIDIYSKRSKAWIRPYLERSFQRPLDVYVDIYRRDRILHKTPNPLTGYHTIIEQLSMHIHRLRIFSLICYHRTTAVHWQSKFRNCYAPILESFSVKFGSSLSVLPGLAQFTTVLDGGSHDHLSFIETDTPNILPQNLRNLTTLYLHGLDPSVPFSSDEFIQTFASIPSIVNLSLQGTVAFGFWPTGMPFMPQFTLNNLKSLRLVEGGGVAIRMLLALSAQHLESLWLECSYENFPTHLFGAAQFNILGKPKFPNLKYLTISLDNFTTTARFATIFPTITHLHYRYPFYNESTQLIQTFAASGWPSLQVLAFTAFKHKHARKLNTALVGILTHRRLDNNPLSRILMDKDHIRWLDHAVPYDWEAKKLRQLVEIELLTVDNYSEYWWSTFERNSERGTG